MFINRYSEVIFPAVQVGRLACGFSFFLSIFINLHGACIYLGTIEIKHKQILTLAVDELANDLVPMILIPIHHAHDLSKEQRADHFLWFATNCTP